MTSFRVIKPKFSGLIFPPNEDVWLRRGPPGLSGLSIYTEGSTYCNEEGWFYLKRSWSLFTTEKITAVTDVNKNVAVNRYFLEMFSLDKPSSLLRSIYKFFNYLCLKFNVSCAFLHFYLFIYLFLLAQLK